MILRDRNIFSVVLDNADISERELARRAGLSHATVNHLMTGRRTSCSVETAVAITVALDIPVGVLFIAERRAEHAVVAQYQAAAGRRR